MKYNVTEKAGQEKGDGRMRLNRVTDAARNNRKAIIAALISSVVLSCIYFFAERAGTDGHVLIPWRSTIIGFIGFGVLFVFAAEKRLMGRERNLFGTLRSEGNGAAIATEAIYQAAMAGVYFLLFNLIGGETLSLFFRMFLGIAAVICAAATAHLEIPAWVRKALLWIAYGLLIVYYIYNLSLFGYTAFSERGAEIFLPIIRGTQKWMHIAGLILVIAQFRTDARRALGACVVGVLLYFVWQDSGLPLVMEFGVLMLLSNFLGKARTISKVTLAAFGAYVAFLAIGLAVGWVENRTFSFEYATDVPAYGMGHSNLPALLLMSILLLIWYLWAADKPLITFVLFWGSASGIWFMTYCRTVAVVMAVFPIANLIRTWLCKRKAGKGMRIAVYLPLIFAAVSVALMFWLPTQTLFNAKGNSFLRFTDPYRFAQDHGITMFGTTIRDSYVLDNVYLHLLMYFGIVGLAVTSGVLTWVGGEYYRNKQWAELTMLAIVLFYSLMENAVIHQPFGFAAMLIGRQPTQPGDGRVIQAILQARNEA